MSSAPCTHCLTSLKKSGGIVISSRHLGCKPVMFTFSRVLKLIQSALISTMTTNLLIGLKGDLSGFLRTPSSLRRTATLTPCMRPHLTHLINFDLFFTQRRVSLGGLQRGFVNRHPRNAWRKKNARFSQDRLVQWV